jgi:hypothetical protein
VNLRLERLEKLVGRWSIEDEARGETRWRWAEGKRFLFQDFDITQGGRHHTVLEVIGHLQRLDESPSPEIWSRAYHFGSGLTLDYVYEMEGDTLTIWFRHKGSDNRMRGCFSPDGTRYDAAWEWPGAAIGSREKGSPELPAGSCRANSPVNPALTSLCSSVA